MALRVLLADESPTIKKVMQLALQDFSVEVKAVPIGLDVLQVTRAFHPDLIFADVLLSKKTGYDVAAEIKADTALKKIPVVLMWSGFMELDEARAKACGAEQRLEKPFDADHLRNLVRELVPRLKTSQIADFLTFPDLPDIVETPADPPPFKPKASITPPPAGQAAVAPGLEAKGPPAAAAPKGPPASAQPAAPVAQKGPPATTPIQAPVTQKGPPTATPKAGAPTPSALAANAADALEQFTVPTAKKGPGLPAATPAAPTERKSLPPIGSTASKPPEVSFRGFEDLEKDLEDPDDFQQVPLPGSKTKNTFEKRDDEEWRQGGLEQFRVAPVEGDFEAPVGLSELSGTKISTTDGVESLQLEELEDLAQVNATPGFSQDSFEIDPDLQLPDIPEMLPDYEPMEPMQPMAPISAKQSRGDLAARNDLPPSFDPPLPPTPSSTMSSMNAMPAGIDSELAEQMIREQVRSVLESIAWKIIPDIAERVVREEIQRLLKEAERL